MPRPVQTAETEARRLRAFDLYFHGAVDGSKRSLRSIALELGVTLKTVQFWRERDRWDDRIDTALSERTKAQTEQALETTELMNTSLKSHIGTLNALINDAKQEAADRIRAIKEFVSIYRQLGLKLDPAGAQQPASNKVAFNDDIEQAQPEPTEPTDDEHLQ